MKKYNEGYALPFVLVVFLVITLVATSVLAVSLRNLQSQKASVQRMEEQYEVQGEIEKVHSQIYALIQNDWIAITEDILDNDLDIPATIGVIGENSNIEALTLSVESTNGTVRIQATLKIEGGQISPIQGGYRVDAPIISYDSYTITTVDPDAESRGAA